MLDLRLWFRNKTTLSATCKSSLWDETNYECQNQMSGPCWPALDIRKEMPVMNLLLQITEPSIPSSSIGMWDFKLLLWCSLGLHSSGMLHGVGWQALHSVAEEWRLKELECVLQLTCWKRSDCHLYKQVLCRENIHSHTALSLNQWHQKVNAGVACLAIIWCFCVPIFRDLKRDSFWTTWWNSEQCQNSTERASCKIFIALFPGMAKMLDCIYKIRHLVRLVQLFSCKTCKKCMCWWRKLQRL